MTLSPPSSPSLVRALEKYLSQPIDLGVALLQASAKKVCQAGARQTKKSRHEKITPNNNFISSTPNKRPCKQKSPSPSSSPAALRSKTAMPAPPTDPVTPDSIFSPVFHLAQGPSDAPASPISLDHHQHPIDQQQLSVGEIASLVPTSPPHIAHAPTSEMLEAPTYFACHEYVQGINTCDENFADMALFLKYVVLWEICLPSYTSRIRTQSHTCTHAHSQACMHVRVVWCGANTFHIFPYLEHTAELTFIISLLLFHNLTTQLSSHAAPDADARAAAGRGGQQDDARVGSGRDPGALQH